MSAYPVERRERSRATDNHVYKRKPLYSKRNRASEYSMSLENDK